MFKVGDVIQNPDTLSTLLVLEVTNWGYEIVILWHYTPLLGAPSRFAFVPGLVLPQPQKWVEANFICVT